MWLGESGVCLGKVTCSVVSAVCSDGVELWAEREREAYRGDGASPGESTRCCGSSDIVSGRSLRDKTEYGRTLKCPS